MAQSLAADLQRADPGASIVIRNDFAVLGRLLGRRLARGYAFHLRDARRSYDIAYRLFTGLRAAQTLGELALYALGGAPLARTISDVGPDVVVATHPVLNAVLARLRASRRVPCPAAVVVGPLGGLGFWVQPGADLHLLNYPEALREVQREAAPGSAVAVRPLVGEEFFFAPTQVRARAQLGIPAQHPLVLISGGGWGAGDLDGAIDAALNVPDAAVIAVAGRNQRVPAAITQRHASDPRLTLVGFTTRMCELLSAADAFVTTTAGLSCLEAQLCGCPTVWYGFGAGHVRDNVAALQRHGLARAAQTPKQLTSQLKAVLATGRGQTSALPELPRAGQLLLELANHHRELRSAAVTAG
jgi:UDP-N-acetylglucosamine:LPS N-acetylglucosamine transferase